MRKGILASLALVLGHTSAQAQYWPAPQQPVYYPMPQNGAAWVAPPGYNLPQQARAAYPPPGPNYLPQSYFPGQPVRQQAMYQPMPLPMPMASAPAQSRATPVPAEPVSTVLPPASTFVEAPARASIRQQFVGGPASFGLDVVPAAPIAEPVVYYRTPTDRCWFSTDILRAWITPGPLNTPLLTLGSTNQASPGNLAEDGTVILFGDKDLNFRMLNGLKAEIGMFCDEDCRFSLDLGGFYYLPAHVRYSINSDANGMPVISIPFFSTDGTGESIYEVSDPVNLITGSSKIEARTQIWGLEANGRFHSYCGRRLHTEVLAGFRTMRLKESFSMTTNSTDQIGGTLTYKTVPLLAGETIIDQDHFKTANQFYGFQVGGKLRYEFNCASIDAFAKVAVGVTDQQVLINGSATLVTAAGNDVALGGIFALPSNIGEHNRQIFGVVPEVGFALNADVHQNIRVRAGYSCLLWSAVARPTAQIDRNINPVQVASDPDYTAAIGANRPAFNYRENVFFLQSLNFGVELHY